jgi:hypothetical protein
VYDAPTTSAANVIYVSIDRGAEPPGEASGGVREPRRPKPPRLSPGAEAEPAREAEGLRLIGVTA